jgi:hypothetical protein
MCRELYKKKKKKIQEIQNNVILEVLFEGNKIILGHKIDTPHNINNNIILLLLLIYIFIFFYN